MIVLSPAFAVDLQPNDVVAPAPNLNTIMATYYSTRASGAINNGTVLAGSPVLEGQVGILRYTHTYEVAGMPAASYIQGSNGGLTPEGSLAKYPSSTGMGDSVLATAVWPYSNRQTRTYLGVAAYASLPTGSYDAQKPFNLGSNRYSNDLQVGFQRPIVGNLDGVIAFDTQWFGANSQCAATCGSTINKQLTQKPLYTTQLGPIYKINDIFTVGASYFYVSGAQTAINNIANSDMTLTQRYSVSAIAYTDYGCATVRKTFLMLRNTDTLIF